MTKNVFKFGDTWWQQSVGTAMGTPCACAYATIFFAHFERTHLLPRYKENIILYLRQIDDILLIWKNNVLGPQAYTSFKSDLQKQCKLKWTTEHRGTVTKFLDLTIKIEKTGNIVTKTFQKKMTLFLYIPAHSSHPPGLTKSLIYGLVGTYWIQNSRKEDFIHTTKLLYDRLIARGYKHEVIGPIFLEAATKLHDRNKSRPITIPQKSKSENNNDRLSFIILFTLVISQDKPSEMRTKTYAKI